MRAALRAPLPDGAVQKNPSKTYLSTIKPIFVTERLNDVFGVGSWQVRTELVAPITAEAKTKGARTYTDYTSLMKTIFTIPEYGVYHECIAGSSNEDEGDAAKGGTTDGLTKICSWLEIGINVFKGLGNVADPIHAANKPIQTEPIKVQPTTTPLPESSATEAQPPGLAVKYASARQKEEIIRLLNNPVVTKQEKSKMLLNLGKLDEERATQAIAKLKKVIEDREEEQTAAA